METKTQENAPQNMKIFEGKKFKIVFEINKHILTFRNVELKALSDTSATFLDSYDNKLKFFTDVTKLQVKEE